MSLSLRDQLLKAGLVTEKQVEHADRQQKRQQYQQPRGKKQDKADRKARFAQIKQLVELHQVARVETEDFYNFVDGTRIKRVPVNAELRERLIRGDLAIVRNEGRYAFVPAGIAADIRARVERAVIHHNVPKADDVGDDPYKDFVVPDDLIW